MEATLIKKEHRGCIDEPKWSELQVKRDRTLGEVLIQLFAHENNIDINRLINSYKGKNERAGTEKGNH